MIGSRQLKLADRIAIRKLKESYVIVTLDNVLHKVEDPVGVFILDRLNEKGHPWTVDGIWDMVTKEFDVSKDSRSARKSVEVFLKSLTDKGIIESS